MAPREQCSETNFQSFIACREDYCTENSQGTHTVPPIACVEFQLLSREALDFIRV